MRILVYVLIFGLVVGAAVTVWLKRRHDRHAVRKLPSETPDFQRVEAIVREAVSRHAGVVSLRKFTSREWVAEAQVLHCGMKSEDAQDILSAISEEIRARSGHPVRIAGWILNADDRSVRGTLIDIGYTLEMGYDHMNELYEERRAERGRRPLPEFPRIDV